MITHCSNCNTNWARLHFCDMTSEEQIEVCPVCKTDFFLEEGTDIIGYICCPITARIYQTGFGKAIENVLAPVQVLQPVVIEDPGPTWAEKTTMRENRELDAILAYQSSGNPQDYFNTIRKPKTK